MLAFAAGSIGVVLLLLNLIFPSSDGAKRTARAVNALSFLVLALLLKR
ncbi:hypothetical protein [Bradyrhizobium sp. RT3a]